MRISFCFAVAFAALASIGTLHAQQAASAPRADGAVTPLRVYAPTGMQESGCPPLALVSHGAGGNERGMRYLARALSGNGWRVIVMGHRESGGAALRADLRAHGIHGGVAALVDDADAYRARFMDIEAARQWADRRCRAPFTVLLGHSMGARTVQLEAGATNRLGLHPAGGFDAYVALSPAGPDALFPPDAERGIRAPMLLVTGTRDDGLDGDYRWRTQAFDALPAGCHALAVIDGSMHMNFAGVGLAGRTEKAVVALTTRWLDALRQGRCIVPPTLPGVTVTAK